MIRYPFICLVSRGNHSHYPPRPTNLPSDLKETIQEFISKDDVLALTTGMLIINNAYAKHSLTLYQLDLLSHQLTSLLLRSFVQSHYEQSMIVLILRIELVL
jgi:hypothetical protein